MREFLYSLREIMSKPNVWYYPFPVGDGQWRTYDFNLYNSYASAVKHSKENSLPKVTVKTWNETTQQYVYAKTYW